MKTLTPETLYAEGIFSIQPPICAANFSNNILNSGS